MKVTRFASPAMLRPEYFLHVSFLVSLRCKYGMLYSSTNFFCDSILSMDIAKDILAEEVEHESWFLELLYTRPSGHMRRKYSGERPHTSKHSRSLG